MWLGDGELNCTYETQMKELAQDRSGVICVVVMIKKKSGYR